jgi:hypothetical protein
MWILQFVHLRTWPSFVVKLHSELGHCVHTWTIGSELRWCADGFRNMKNRSSLQVNCLFISSKVSLSFKDQFSLVLYCSSGWFALILPQPWCIALFLMPVLLFDLDISFDYACSLDSGLNLQYESENYYFCFVVWSGYLLWLCMFLTTMFHFLPILQSNIINASSSIFWYWAGSCSTLSFLLR